MTKLNITLVQPDLVWENKTANLSKLEKMIASVSAPNEIIVLPEMFSTGFTMKPEQLAETADNEIFRWLKKLSAKKDMIVCGSLSVNENNNFVNRLVWQEPNGNVIHYDKRHLFRFAKEHQHYISGKSKQIITYNNWRIFPVVCYDLRFPVWLRRTKQEDYDLMIVVANWPERRAEHWRILLQARAIENQCYVVGVNRVGEDGNKIPHSGDSMVISPKGEVLVHLKNEEQIASAILDLNEVQTWRDTFPAGEDADDFEIKF